MKRPASTSRVAMKKPASKQPPRKKPSKNTKPKPSKSEEIKQRTSKKVRGVMSKPFLQRQNATSFSTPTPMRTRGTPGAPQYESSSDFDGGHSAQNAENASADLQNYLEDRDSFGGFNPQNKGQMGSRYILTSIFYASHCDRASGNPQQKNKTGNVPGVQFHRENGGTLGMVPIVGICWVYLF